MGGEGTALVKLRALAEEQAALRRVATMVAGDADPAHVFAGVCREVGGVLGVGSTNLVRFNDADEGEVVGAWSASGAPVVPADTVVPLDGDSALVQVWRTGGPGRVDDYNGMPGRLPQRLIRVGIVSSVAGPVTVANRLWGGIIASSGTAHDFPEGAEAKLTAFAELVADALASTEAREQLRGLARAAGGGGRRGAPPPGAQSPRRRAATARGPGSAPGRRAEHDRVRSRGGATAARRGARGAGRGAGGVARAGARHPPGGAQRPRAERGPGGAGRSLAGLRRAGDCTGGGFPRTWRPRPTTWWPRR